MRRGLMCRGMRRGLIRRGLKPTATVEASRSEAGNITNPVGYVAILRRGLKPTATIETSRCEVKGVAERRVMVARPFKAGKEGMGVDVATVDSCREGDVPATTRRGLKPTATVGTTIGTSRGETKDVAERRVMVARPFKAGKENPHPPSSRSDERSARTIARNVVEIWEAWAW
jgi:hypothetical protein